MEKTEQNKKDQIEEKQSHKMWTERNMTLYRKRSLKRESVISQ